MSEKDKIIIKNHDMKTQDITVGSITSKENAERTAVNWHRPKDGYHAQAVKKGEGYICRLVIND